jgi:hypothetical protein
MAFRAFTLLALAALMTFSLPAQAQDKKPPPVVAVFEIENRGSPLTGDELIALTDYLGTKLGERGRFQIIPRQEIRKRLVQQKKASFKACYDQSCQIEVGRELAAQFTVSTSISRVGRTCIVTSALYDLRKAATATTASAKGPCTADDLLAAMDKIADKLEGGKPAKVKPPAPRPQPVVRKIEKTPPLPAPQPPPTAPVRQPRSKSTVVACLLSIGLPGAGMFYLEKWGWGIFYTGGTVGGIVAGGVMLGSSIDGDGGELAAAIVLLVAGVVLYPISIIHTYSAAENWRDPDVERISPGQSILPVSIGEPARNGHPALVVPIFTGRF